MTLTNLEKGAGAQGGAAVRLGKVHFSYGEAPFVFDVEFAVSKITAIMGPSGSGKSTLLNLVAGFETPQSGRVLIDGADMTARQPPARPVSMVFQENNLFAHLSVERNVGLGRSPSLSLSEADRGAIAEALRRVGLAGKEKRLPRELSGGERQRVALARVLVRDRPVLLLDEPFASLGPALRNDMLDLVAGAARGTAHDGAVRHPPARRRAPHRPRHGIPGRGHGCRDRRRVRFFCRVWTRSLPALYRLGYGQHWITRCCPEADIIYGQTGSRRGGAWLPWSK